MAAHASNPNMHKALGSIHITHYIECVGTRLLCQQVKAGEPEVEGHPW